MSRATTKDAIAAWVRGASGLLVTWAGRGAPAPEAVPYISMRLSSTGVFGVDWLDSERNPLVLADDVVDSVSAAADTLTLTGHAYLTGDGPVQVANSGGALPGGIVAATDYWIIKVSANVIQLAASFQNAIAAVPTPLAISSAGSGTHTISDTSLTLRAGQEVARFARGTREAKLTLQCFADPVQGADDEDEPDAILELVRLAAEDPDVEDALNEAGIGLGAFEPIVAMDGAVGGLPTEVSAGGSLFEPRAIMVVNLNLTAEAVTYGGMIERVEVEVEVKAPDGSGDVLDSEEFVVDLAD
jgi:hypothetical protein